jgi:acyl-CoA thioester hydrolase
MQPFHFFKPLEIRYGDLDPQGHVNNARYLTYLEQARIAYITHLNLWDGQSFAEVGIILADAHITFRALLLFGSQIQVGVRVTRLGGKSLTMEYIIEDSQTRQELAHAATVLVAYDYHQNRTIPVPENWRQRIAEFENLPPNV